ncbi:DUF2318 domain-containing protein [Candidatus Aenigmatarchaeota archaeon]
MTRKIIIGIVVILILVVGLAIGLPGITGNVVNENNNEEFTVPLSEVSENAKFYEYDSDGKTIRFFAVKASDGTIKTAFDQCDVCYRSGKGYRQEGDNMVCNNCGNKYPIIGLGTENKNPGGCWPSYLPSKIEGDNVIIKKSDLDKGKS